MTQDISRRTMMGLGGSSIAAAALPMPSFTSMAVQQQVMERPIRTDIIIKCICLNFGISVERLMSSERSRYVVKARQYGMYLSRTLTTRSLPEIGRRFGGRDHTTVLYASRKINALKETDKDVVEDIAFLTNCVRHMHAIKCGARSVLHTPMTVGRSFG